MPPSVEAHRSQGNRSNAFMEPAVAGALPVARAARSRRRFMPGFLATCLGRKARTADQEPLIARNQTEPVPIAPTTSPATTTCNAEDQSAHTDLKNYVDGLYGQVTSHLTHLVTNPQEHARNAGVPQELQSIRESLDLLIDKLEEGPTSGIHRAARDTFAQIKSICEKAAARFPRSCASKVETARDLQNLAGDERTYRFLKTFGTLSNELKRHHFTRAANEELFEYAAERVKEKTRINPGFIDHRVGSEQKTINDLSVGAKIGAIGSLGMMGKGIFGQIKCSFEKRSFIDDDTDPVQTNTWSLGLRVGIGSVTNKKQNRFKLITKVLTFGLVGKAGVTLGEYFDFKNPIDFEKTKLLRKGQKWCYLRQSGDTQSRGANLNQFLAYAKYRVNTVVRCGGQLQAAPLRKPNVSEKKLLKGSNNGHSIVNLTRNLHDLNPIGHTSSIESHAKAAYGVPGIELDMDDMFVAAEHPIKPHVLIGMSPLPAPGGGEGISSIRRAAFGFEAAVNFKMGTNIAHNKGIGQLSANGSASCEYGFNNTILGRQRAAHVHLDTNYNCDINKSRSLIEDLKKNCEGNPKIYFSEKVIATLPVPKDDAPRHEYIQKFPSIQSALDETTKRYLQLSKISSLKRSLQDPKYRRRQLDSDKSAHNKLEDDFIAEVFGVTGQSLNPDAKFYKKLKSNPDFFMIQAYDSLSITLGRLGVEIYGAKENTYAIEKSKGIYSNETKRLREKTDHSYNYLKTVMDNILLPIDREKLLKGGRFEAKADSRNNTFTATLDASANIGVPPMQQIPYNQSDPTSPPKKHPDENHFDGKSLRYGLNTAFAGIGMKYEEMRRWATKHPNFLRIGNFTQRRIILKASGLLGSSLEYLQTSDLANSGKDRSLKSKFCRRRVTNNCGKKLPAPGVVDAISRIGRTGIMDQVGESDFQLGWRTPVARENQKNFTYEKCLQWTRYAVSQSEAVGATFGVPLHALGYPITPSASFLRTKSNRSVNIEIIGDCPAHHLLVLPQLTRFLNVKNRGEGVLTEEERLDSIKKKFMSEDNDPFGNAAYMRNRYFSNPEGLMGVLEKFVKYDNSDRPELGSDDIRPHKQGYVRTEFDRFDDDADTRKLMKSMVSAKKFSPGSDYSSIDSNQEEITDPRPRLTYIEGEAIRQCREFFNRCKRENRVLSVKDIMEYFLAGGSTPGGSAFNAYLKIMNAYDGINDAVKSRVTYESKVT